MRRASAVLCLTLLAIGCAHGKALKPGEALTEAERRAAIRKADVWTPTDIASVDIAAGPAGARRVRPDAWIECKYKADQSLTGHSPKFECETSPGHEVKVKYGERNAEVFGEVLSTRLFWALGFAADRMYPVRVRCHGCPEDPKAASDAALGVVTFDPAAIEEKLPGRPMETHADSGWSWSELDDLGPDAPPHAREQRDALKLLAAFVQHTDSKSANQRLLCPAGEEVGRTGCRRPVLMVNDLGLTFGQAGLLIKNKNSVSLDTWARVPVWTDAKGCEAKLNGSLTGSLSSPRISEGGRAFLAGLLQKLSDAQLRALFETARVDRRSSDPSGDPAKEPPNARVDAWVAAFKAKRAQIVDRTCPS